jgi:hypothetical protein
MRAILLIICIIISSPVSISSQGIDLLAYDVVRDAWSQYSSKFDDAAYADAQIGDPMPILSASTDEILKYSYEDRFVSICEVVNYVFPVTSSYKTLAFMIVRRVDDCREIKWELSSSVFSPSKDDSFGRAFNLREAFPEVMGYSVYYFFNPPCGDLCIIENAENFLFSPVQEHAQESDMKIGQIVNQHIAIRHMKACAEGIHEQTKDLKEGAIKVF